jgi:hypothetical protein
VLFLAGNYRTLTFGRYPLARLPHGKPETSNPHDGRFTRLEKSLRLCLAGLRIRRFDPIAEASELSDHSRSALLLGLLGDCRAPFFVRGCLMQDQPDQATLSMGDDPDGLIMSEVRDTTAADDLEDTSFDFYGGVGSLIE